MFIRPVTIVRVSFFNDTATTEIYTLSLHDALPISHRRQRRQLLRHAHRRPDEGRPRVRAHRAERPPGVPARPPRPRSEEHTSELQSRQYLVCRLLLEQHETSLPILARRHDVKDPLT